VNLLKYVLIININIIVIIKKMLNKEKALLLKQLQHLDNKKLRHYIAHVDKDGIESLCECVFNTIYTELPLDSTHKNNIKKSLKSKKSKSNIKIISKKQNSIRKKRAALLQEGKGLGFIISALAPLLANLFLK